MGMTFHSHACIFTRLQLMGILTHALEISPHTVRLLVLYIYMYTSDVLEQKWRASLKLHYC